MGPYRVKFDEEKSKHAALAGENGFEQSIFAQFAEARKRQSTLCTCQERMQ
jgi:hypothetical protein